MKVFVNALEVKLKEAKEISISEYWNYLISCSGQEFFFDKHRRLMYVTEYDKHYAVMLITIRDEKKFCALKQEGEKLSLSVEQLDGNESFMDFNFFIYIKSTNRGLLQNYRNSCSMIRFCCLLESRYYQFYRLHITSLANQIKMSDFISEKSARAKAQKRCKKGTLTVNPLVNKATFNQLLDEFIDISSFRFQYNVWDDKESLFKASTGIVKTRTEEIRFIRDDVERIRRAISSSIRGNPNAFSSGTVFGKNADDRELSLKIESNKYDFGTEEFDKVTDKLNFGNLDNFKTCKIFNDLTQIWHDNSDIFGE